MKKILILFLFIIFTPLNLGISLLALDHLPKPKPIITSFQPQSSQPLFTALPPVVGQVKGSFNIADARPVLITNFLEKNNSPILPYVEEILKAAERYQIDYRFLLAIAQCESNLCKKIPEDSYNCWGWANGEAKFDSWEQAFDEVAKTLKSDYIDQGLTTPDKIMPKYAPPSVEKGGPWAKCVTQFMDELEKGE